MSQLLVENLTLAYEGTPVVQSLSFTVCKGDYLCIIGENGSGKSTLIKGILGLIEPVSGKVRFGDGISRKSVGYLPQQTQVQRDFPASVKEVVLSGCISSGGFHPFYKTTDRKKAAEKMHLLGIDSLVAKSYRNLSGGQQQRVLLARALCAANGMLLLDEPVTGLDPEASEAMYSIIGELNRNGMTVIMISHDIDAAVANASHILNLSHDKAFFGTAEEYLKGMNTAEHPKDGNQ